MRLSELTMNELGGVVCKYVLARTLMFMLMLRDEEVERVGGKGGGEERGEGKVMIVGLELCPFHWRGA